MISNHATDHVDRLGKGHLDRRIARSVSAVRARIGAQHQWPEFNDGRGLTRRRRARDEVASISVGVCASTAQTEYCGCIASRGRRRRPLPAVSTSVADKVHHVWITGRTVADQPVEAVDEGDLSTGAAHVDLADDIRRRQRQRRRSARRQRDQEVLTGSDRSSQRLFAEIPAASCRRRVLQRPAADVDRGRAAVVQLDVIVLIRGAGVASAAIELADHDHAVAWLRRGRAGVCGRREWACPADKWMCCARRQCRWGSAGSTESSLSLT